MSILQHTIHVSACRFPAAALALGLFIAGAVGAGAAEEVCPAGTTRVSRLGTDSSFSPAPVDSWDEFSSFFRQESVQTEVAKLLEGSEWEELLEPISRALASRQGYRDDTWTVRWREDVALTQGSRLQWMIFRGRLSGRALLGTGPYCVATPEPYMAWGLEVVKTERVGCETKRTTWEFAIPEACANLSLVGRREESKPYTPPGAECSLEVERMCEAGAIKVDASGSSAGVKVTMNGRPVSLGQNLMAQVPDPDPFSSADFMATVELADECARPRTCSKKASLPAETPPQCTLTVPEKVTLCETFPVGMAGHWQSGEVEVTNEAGETVATLSGPFPTELALCEPGTYTLTGTAGTSCGSETCTALVEVPRRSRWTLRGYPVFFLGDDVSSQLKTTRVNDDDDLVERFDLSIESGNGLGVAAEYRFRDRVGLEVGFMAAQIDTDFRVEQALLWGGQALYEETAVVDEEIDVQAFTLGLNFHLTPNRPADFYVGPVAGVADIDGSFPLRFLPQDDLTQNRTLRRKSSESFFGAQLGLDIPFNNRSRWAFHLGVMYIDLSSDGPGGEVDLGPWVARGGLAFRPN